MLYFTFEQRRYDVEWRVLCLKASGAPGQVIGNLKNGFIEGHRFRAVRSHFFQNAGRVVWI